MSLNLQNSNKDVVLVTGFGPFRFHEINASWEAVKLLQNYHNDNFTIITEQIPVEYEIVDIKLPLLWSELSPKLVVHVGVSHMANKLTLETSAHQKGYLSSDAVGKLCQEGKCCTLNDSPDVLQTGVDIDNICVKFNMNSKQVQACVSKNAGRYLCEYIYFKSLSFNSKCSIFIHVPMLNEPYTVEELTEGLLKIINIVYEQLYNEGGVTQNSNQIHTDDIDIINNTDITTNKL